MIEFYDVIDERRPLTAYTDYHIVHKSDGCDKMSFCLETSHPLYAKLFEECRVVTDDNEWLIKKIDDDRIGCELNFDFLKTRIYENYRSETESLQIVLENHLPSGWTIEGGNVSSIRRTIEFDFCTDFDIIYRCMKVYSVNFVWKIKEKRLIVYSHKLMQPTGEYVTSELNLKALSFKGETTGFATRLYAFGKEHMTMEEAVVDGVPYGKTYVENKSYTGKTVCAYWIDERFTVPSDLYEAAMNKVNTMSFPVRSYECEVEDLAKQNSNYSFLDFQIHKKITLIDVSRNIKVEHHIVEYDEYPEESKRNKITLSCVPETIQGSISNISSSLDDRFEMEHEKQDTSYTERLAMATAMMTGAFGGYPYKTDSELFILDDPDPAKAQRVWRWNINGFGKSSTGIDGPYTTAMTFDDHFLTSVIDAMVIRADKIVAGKLQSRDGSSYWDLDTGEVHIGGYATNDDVTKAIDGIQMPDGSFVYIRYSEFADGHDMVEVPVPGVHKYTGILSTNNKADQYDYTKYTWSLNCGKDGYTPVKDKDYFDGKPGDPGAPGADGKTPHIFLRYSDDGKSFTGTSIIPTEPVWENGKYSNLGANVADSNSIRIKDRFSVTPGTSYLVHTGIDGLDIEIVTYSTIGARLRGVIRPGNNGIFTAASNEVNIKIAVVKNGYSGTLQTSAMEELKADGFNPRIFNKAGAGTEIGAWRGELVTYEEQASEVFSDYTWVKMAAGKELDEIWSAIEKNKENISLKVGTRDEILTAFELDPNGAKLKAKDIDLILGGANNEKGAITVYNNSGGVSSVLDNTGFENFAGNGSSVALNSLNYSLDGEGNINDLTLPGLKFKNSDKKLRGELVAITGLGVIQMNTYKSSNELAAQISLSGTTSPVAHVQDYSGSGRILSTGNLLIETGIDFFSSAEMWQSGNRWMSSHAISGFNNQFTENAIFLATAHSGADTTVSSSKFKTSDNDHPYEHVDLTLSRPDKGSGTSVGWMIIELKA